jgi:hypothetical protein
MNAFAAICNINLKEDLARWREIDGGVRQQAQSFIVS